jgi:hypothetical protein
VRHRARGLHSGAVAAYTCCALLRLLVRGVLVALVLTLLPAGPAASRRAAEGDVYRLVVTAKSKDGAEQWTEWVEPSSGQWRIEQAGRTYIYTGASYAILDRRQGAHVRTGSPLFLGTAPNRAVSREPLRKYLAGDSAGIEVTTVDGKVELGFKRPEASMLAAIVEKIPPAEVQQRKLLVIPPDEVTSAVTERRVGLKPTLAVRAYWFGMRFAGRLATVAVEHFAGPAARGASRTAPTGPSFAYHLTFYERPSAAGKTSAYPGQRAPSGEVQVLSQSVTSSVARRTIRAYDGVNGELRTKRWPRSTIKLANGESATLVPDRSGGTGKVRMGFAVITRTTLVNVSGSFRLSQIPATAALLRPLG